MRATIIVIVFILAALQAVASDTTGVAPNGGADFARSKGCTGCHNVAVDLSGRGMDTIFRQTKAILSGQKDHSPTLLDLSDEDIERLATYLDDA